MNKAIKTQFFGVIIFKLILTFLALCATPFRVVSSASWASQVLASIRTKHLMKAFVLFVWATFVATVLTEDEPATQLWNKYTNQNGNYIIPYHFSGVYSDEERSKILSAMKKIAANTCVEFKPRKNEEDYVDIINAESEG
ncbi:unnamed protein product [Cylicocyclus nassatus]|uniref:Peptidase M12A domain-containing protein n=1 Tax=Cylicocyclus nassatus TaxID=53992 RepID=A0AA36M6G7_CYLNA|nr:unnamed protein product [Cylicocyclus nassatus]